MPLHNENGPLPYGEDYEHDGNVIAYASLLTMAFEEREAWGVFWVEPAPDSEPEPPRRVIPKSVVQARVIELGKINAVWAALNADIANLVRWLAPDWPNVYFDDEGLIAVLTAVGCTPAEIDAITAP